jgi:hypothetical protein
MKRTDARGRPLNYEAGQLHQQIDLIAPANGQESAPPRETFRTKLDRLVDTYELQGKAAAVLYVTRQQEQEVRTFMARPENPLAYRGHRVVIVAEPEKL